MSALLSKRIITPLHATRNLSPKDKNLMIEYYNLDAIISIGYRVNSLQATNFRIWATEILRDHIIKGYTLNQNRLAENGIKEIQQSLSLIQKTLIDHGLVTDLGKHALQIITEYAKSWRILLAYDEDKLTVMHADHQPHRVINYDQALQIISTLKVNLMVKGEASPLFGNERDNALAGILGNIEQTFDGQSLYPSVEEKAANLLYFVIKDHPFIDGNKRIACLLFIAYLNLQGVKFALNENGMVALALLTAESNSDQKNLIIKLITNLVNNESENSF